MNFFFVVKMQEKREKETASQMKKSRNDASHPVCTLFYEFYTLYVQTNTLTHTHTRNDAMSCYNDIFYVHKTHHLCVCSDDPVQAGTHSIMFGDIHSRKWFLACKKQLQMNLCFIQFTEN